MKVLAYGVSVSAAREIIGVDLPCRAHCAHKTSTDPLCQVLHPPEERHQASDLSMLTNPIYAAETWLT